MTTPFIPSGVPALDRRLQQLFDEFIARVSARLVADDFLTTEFGEDLTPGKTQAIASRVSAIMEVEEDFVLQEVLYYLQDTGDANEDLVIHIVGLLETDFGVFQISPVIVGRGLEIVRWL